MFYFAKKFTNTEIVKQGHFTDKINTLFVIIMMLGYIVIEHLYSFPQLMK